MPANTTEIEKRLWDAADDLRANSKLKSSEYSMPVLGLIFLRYADHKFEQAEQELSGKATSRRRTIGKADYQARGVLFLRTEARFANLLKLPEGANIGAAINAAMKAIEEENDDLRGVLPQNYTAFDNSLLVSLLKTLNFDLANVEGDVFGQIYEYFLGKFAMSEGQKGGEFFTPTVAGQADRGSDRAVSWPPPRSVLRLGRHVRAERGLSGAAQAESQHVDCAVRAGEGGRDGAPVPHESGRARLERRDQAGQHVLRRPARRRGQVRLRDGESAVQRGQGG